ncbi:MAG TPA: type IV pilus secretin PilQ [candidate division Zixibacteria bacterium]|nr:type IV pilus secretin PilQ [candidate division Zixibacteria bacterium]
MTKATTDIRPGAASPGSAARPWIAARVLLAGLLTVHVAGCSLGTDRAAPKAPEAAAARVPQAAAKPAPVKAPVIQDLMVREENGQTILSVRLPQPVQQYRHFPLPQPARIVLDVLGEAKGPAQAESFRVDTNWVSTLRISSAGERPRLVVDIAAATVPPYTIVPENGGVKITVGAPDPAATAKRNIVLVRNGQRADILAADTPGRRAGETKAAGTAREAGGAPEKKYTGQKISLEFKDADIKNVFRLLAEVSGQNIIVTDDVNKKVTIRLTEVPWDQALQLLIDTNGLDKEEVGNVIRISTAERLKSDRDKRAAANKAQEELEPLQTAYFSVNYAKVKDLEPKVKLLISKRGTITSDERSNTIVVKDIQSSIEDVHTMLARLDTRTPQVLIESNLIETTPSFSRALGMELDLVAGRIVASSRFLAGAPFAGSANTTGPPFPVPSTGFRFGYIPHNVNAFLSAAENEGKVRIISRPSVVTLNNVPSTIKSERILRIALPSSTNIASGTGAAAGTAVATEKIPVGINLTVVPQVSSDGFVLMNIKVKSSSVASSPTVSGGTAGVIPFDELNREAEANVLVRDGETIVIGGILKDTDASSESGIPYLKDIPVLGWLFKNWRIQKDFEELVVFITPRIASAGSENLPTAEELWREQMKKTEGAASSTEPATP